MQKTMEGTYAILIDAGFLKRKIGSRQTPATADSIANFCNRLTARPELENFRLHRIYYYDAEPLAGKQLIPLSGGNRDGDTIDFATTPLYQTNMKILEALKKKSYFAIRLGEVHFRGWQLRKSLINPKSTDRQITVSQQNLQPDIHQKGVDMRIGLDIASLSLKNQVDIIALVSGDSDFIPALKFARREGKQVFMYTLGHAIRPEIIGHTDMLVNESLTRL